MNNTDVLLISQIDKKKSRSSFRIMIMILYNDVPVIFYFICLDFLYTWRRHAYCHVISIDRLSDNAVAESQLSVDDVWSRQ